MNHALFRTILGWIEIIVHLVFPVAASLILIYPRVSSGGQIDADTLIKLILALVAGIAISRTFERYVTLKGIEGQTREISRMSNVRLLRSALEYKVVDLFPRADAERLSDIVETINNARGTLDICGIALPTMVQNDSFRGAVLQHSQRHDVRVMLLKPDSDEAARRANIEAPLGRRTIADIEITGEWLKAQQVDNKRFRLHFYDLPPIASLVITDQYVFVEPYHFGRPEGVEGCIGGYVPMMKIGNLPGLDPKKNPYAFFKAHFEYLWNFTRGLRVNLDILLLRAEPSEYVVMQNRTGKNIPMDGWELTGQDGHRPYEFEPDFVWEKGKQIVITRDSELCPDGPRPFVAEGDFLGNNTILRLTNAVGILVAEWSIPLATDGIAAFQDTAVSEGDFRET